MIKNFIAKLFGFMNAEMLSAWLATADLSVSQVNAKAMKAMETYKSRADSDASEAVELQRRAEALQRQAQFNRAKADQLRSIVSMVRTTSTAATD